MKAKIHYFNVDSYNDCWLLHASTSLVRGAKNRLGTRLCQYSLIYICGASPAESPVHDHGLIKPASQCSFLIVLRLMWPPRHLKMMRGPHIVRNLKMADYHSLVPRPCAFVTCSTKFALHFGGDHWYCNFLINVT